MPHAETIRVKWYLNTHFVSASTDLIMGRIKKAYTCRLCSREASCLVCPGKWPENGVFPGTKKNGKAVGPSRFPWLVEL